MAKVAFIQSFWFEFLGPMYISAYLKAHHHHVELFMGDARTHVVDDVLAYKPDIIAFSVTSGDHHWISPVARAIKKKRDVVSVMGGPHATYYPEAIKQDGIDLLVRGEGEETALELIKALENGRDVKKIKNVVYLEENEPFINPLRPLIENLDCLSPFAGSRTLLQIFLPPHKSEQTRYYRSRLSL